MRVLSEGIGDLHGLSLIGGIIDVHRDGAAAHIAVVAPHQHFLAGDVPGVHAVERMEIPAGRIRVLGRVRNVVVAGGIFHRDFAKRLEPIRTEKELCLCREENVPVLQKTTEGDVVRVGKGNAARPGLGVVL